MRLNQETDYALRLVYAFSRLEPGAYLTAREISDNETIPYRFLLRVMKKLKRAGIIASRQGVDGGYRLAKSPEEINLKDVIESIEGEIGISRCLQNTALCNAGYAPECGVHKTMRVIQENLLKDLHRFNFGNIG